MTLAPETPRLVFSDLATAVRALRQRGLRLTTPRRLVLEAMFTTPGPVSAEHLADELNLDITSVYRNLETLEQHGLAQHVHLGHGPGLYALVGEGEHAFLSCERCGAVRRLTTEQLDPVRDRVRELFGYRARFTHFPIVGLCPVCAEHELSTAPSGSGGPRGEGASGARHQHEHFPVHDPQEHDPHEHEHNHGGYVHSHSHGHGDGSEPQDGHGSPPR